MVKKLHGGFQVVFTLWEISFYASQTYLYAGTYSNAEKFAEKIHKKINFPYKIRELK